MDNFDPYNVFLAIAKNMPQRLKTGFVVQGHILGGLSYYVLTFKLIIWNNALIVYIHVIHFTYI